MSAEQRDEVAARKYEEELHRARGLTEDKCQVCGKDSDHCTCVCPTCGNPCFDDVTLADHGECYDCHHSSLNEDDDTEAICEAERKVGADGTDEYYREVTGRNERSY